MVPESVPERSRREITRRRIYAGRRPGQESVDDPVTDTQPWQSGHPTPDLGNPPNHVQ